MEAPRPLHGARAHFHAALAAFVLPFVLPVVWLLALRSTMRSGDPGGWGKRTLALAIGDLLLIGAVGLASFSGALSPMVQDSESRPAIGVFEAASSERGAVIGGVLPDSPAADAGLLPGDVVVRANGKRIEQFSDLSSVISSSTAGRGLSLEVRRGGQPIDITVVPRPAGEIAAERQGWLLDERRGCDDPPAPEWRTFPASAVGVAALILLLAFAHARIRRAPYGGAWIAVLIPLALATVASLGTAHGLCVALGGYRPSSNLLAVLVQQLVILGGGLALIRVLGRRGMLSVSVPPLLSDARALGLGAFYAVTGTMRVSLLVLVLMALIPGEDLPPIQTVEHFPAQLPPLWLALFAVQAVALAPLSEEILFRGVLLPGLTHQLRPAVAVLLSSVAFAALHLSTHGVGWLAPMFLGMVLAWQRLRTGRLWAPILLHAAGNGMALAIAWS